MTGKKSPRKKVVKKSGTKRGNRKQRKSPSAHPKKKNSSKGLLAIVVILILSILVANGSLVEEDPELQKCPRDVSGPERENAKLIIKYFDSPYCFYCHMQKPSLKAVTKEHNTTVRLEKYDIRYCREAYEYGVRGTPGFIFQIGDQYKAHWGLIEGSRLKAIACEATGECVA